MLVLRPSCPRLTSDLDYRSQQAPRSNRPPMTNSRPCHTCHTSHICMCVHTHCQTCVLTSVQTHVCGTMCGGTGVHAHAHPNTDAQACARERAHTHMHRRARTHTNTRMHTSTGHEWNEDIDNGFRPDGLIRLSRTVTERFLSQENTFYNKRTHSRYEDTCIVRGHILQ